MWSRIAYMEWQTLLPQIGFALFALAFVLAIWRTFKMSPSELERASRLPLEDE